MTVTEDRIESLERQVRRQRRWNRALGAFVLPALMVMSGCLAGSRSDELSPEAIEINKAVSASWDLRDLSLGMPMGEVMARWGEPKNVSVFSGREAWAYGHGNQLILADEDGSGLRLIGWRIGLHSGINPAYRAYKTWDEPKVLVPHATFTIDNVRLVKQRMTPSAVIEIFGNPDELFARDLPDGSEMWWLGYVMGGIADENVFCVDPQLGLITWRVDHMSP